MICPLYPDPTYLIISPEVPGLLYYTHIPAIIISLFVGFYIYFLGKGKRENQLLLLISVLFALWSSYSLIVWTSNSSDVILFVWSFFGILYSALSLASIYFFYVFIDGKDISTVHKGILTLLITPVLLLAPTAFNLYEFDIDVCGIFKEGSIFTTYYYFLGFLAAIWILIAAIKRYFKKENKQQRLKLFFITIGLEAFLLCFFFVGFLSNYLVENGVITDFGLEQYGLLGMMIFIGFLAYMMVRFHTFKAKVFGAQALVAVLWILIGSILLVAKTEMTRIIVSITEIVAIVFGLILISSVKKEIQNKEQIEKLAAELQSANTKLQALDKQKTEFLSFASHQLRTPVTAIKGYASMVLEGSFGEIGKEAKGAVDVILQSAQKLVFVIEDFLNVTRIELGTMKFDFAEADLKEIVEGVVKTMKLIAESRHLTLSTEIDSTKNYKLTIDGGKISQVISNLVDNSIKYTKEGSIKVSLLNLGEKMRVEIKDTGVGIDQETMDRLFQKFSRAYDATRMNTNGTGLGLYVARQLVEAHKGKLWAESEGEGKGTTFIVELPMKK